MEDGAPLTIERKFQMDVMLPAGQLGKESHLISMHRGLLSDVTFAESQAACLSGNVMPPSTAQPPQTSRRAKAGTLPVQDMCTLMSVASSWLTLQWKSLGTSGQAAPALTASSRCETHTKHVFNVTLPEPHFVLVK